MPSRSSIFFKAASVCVSLFFNTKTTGAVVLGQSKSQKHSRTDFYCSVNKMPGPALKIRATGWPRPTARRCHSPENQKSSSLFFGLGRSPKQPSPKSLFSLFVYFLSFLCDSNVIIVQ
jgi:hypothetical protein